jgi:hypothetical protein
MICAAVIQVAEATSAAMRPVIDYPFPIPLTRKGARTDHNSRPPRAKEESPLGEMVAHASSEGYAATSERNPYCYYFKILTRQGPMAAGGEVDYVVRGKMIGGFALVAYPAEYGNSGYYFPEGISGSVPQELQSA